MSIKHRGPQCMGMMFTFVVLLLLGVGDGRAFADTPPTINIRGQLLDASGQALSGLRDYRVQFYDAAVQGALLGDAATGQAELSPEGLFNMQTVISPQAARLMQQKRIISRLCKTSLRRTGRLCCYW